MLSSEIAYRRTRLTNLKPELTDIWLRRLGGDRSTEAEIDELKKYLAITKTTS